MDDSDTMQLESELSFLGFSLNECVLETDPTTARYLRAVHRTALELSVPNRFGVDVGGFWLLAEQLVELRKLPEFYPVDEAPLVAKAVEAYITAQLPSWPNKLSFR